MLLLRIIDPTIRMGYQRSNRETENRTPIRFAGTFYRENAFR